MYAQFDVPGTDYTVGRAFPHAGHDGAPTIHAGAAAHADSILGASSAADAARDAAYHQRHLDSTQLALEQCYAVAGLALPNSARPRNPPMSMPAPASFIGRSETQSAGYQGSCGYGAVKACAVIAAIMLATFGIGGYLSYLAAQ